MKRSILEEAGNPARIQYWKQQVKKRPALRGYVSVDLPRQYVPHEPTERQKIFLAVTAREAFYGGAAGGGKSDGILMSGLQYIHIPDYSALIVRRTYTQLTKPDSILDRAFKWLRGTDAVYNQQEHKFTFPNGAVLQFGYLQYDKDVYNYDGPAFQFIGFDELTQFTEWQYRFLFGRLRKPRGFPVPLRMRSASNPGGVGHLWVKERFIDSRRIFIPARLEDNPHLDIDAYRMSLAELPPIERLQREEGDWEISPEGMIFKREWFTQFVDVAPPDCTRCRFWDLAASQNTGDWTVGALLARDKAGFFYIEDIVRGQWGPGQVERRIKQTADLDGPEVRIRMEQEPGASGKIVINQFSRLLAGYNFKGLPSRAKKTSRWTPLATAADNGIIRIVNGPWNHRFLEEVVNVPADGTPDDQADAASGAYSDIALGKRGFVGVSRV